MGEQAKRMATAWEQPASAARPDPAAPWLPDLRATPHDRDRMLWEAMLAVAPAMCARLERELYPHIAEQTRQLANALLREWEQQCRPS